MARGRFISAKISESEQFADLESHEVRLMFLMMLPHADVEGRMKADTRYLAGKVFTYLGFDAVQIECALADMERAELLRSYSVKGRRYLHFPKFADHQVGLRKDREQPSELPGPEEADTEETPSQTSGGGSAAKARSYSGVAPEKVPQKIKSKSKFKSEVEDKNISSRNRDFASNYQKFKDLWNARKPSRAAALKDNREVETRIRLEIRRLGEEEFFRRAAAALTFVVGDSFHTETRPCPPMTLLRHLDSYAEQAPPDQSEPPPERFAPGTSVVHPVWGVDEVRYYRQDGQVILNNCGATVPAGEVTPCLN